MGQHLVDIGVKLTLALTLPIAGVAALIYWTQKNRRN